jgi:hypothetical protein
MSEVRSSLFGTSVQRTHSSIVSHSIVLSLNRDKVAPPLPATRLRADRLGVSLRSLIQAGGVTLYPRKARN